MNKQSNKPDLIIEDLNKILTADGVGRKAKAEILGRLLRTSVPEFLVERINRAMKEKGF